MSNSTTVLVDLFSSLSSVKDINVKSVKREFDEKVIVRLAALLWLNGQRVDDSYLPAEVKNIVSKACDNPHVRYATLGAVVKVAKVS
jgi:cytidylate kinase